MKEIESIISIYDKIKSLGIKMAMATVIHVEDSSYRRSGARMLIQENGQWTGGISGGCLEGDTLRKAQYAIFNSEPTIVRYDTRDGDENQIGVGLGCNGLIDVLITPLSLDSNNQIEVLRQCTLTREPSIVITIVKSSWKNWKVGSLYSLNSFQEQLDDFPDKIIRDAVIQNISRVKSEEKSRGFTYETHDSIFQIFIEFIPPPIQLLIFGRNYDVIPLLEIANVIGWKCHVFSNINKTSKEIMQLSLSVQAPVNITKLSDPYSAILLMAHDYETDKKNLRNTYNLAMSYVGILGPRARNTRMIQELNNEGLPINTDKVYTPMGLDTGATTPEEIAISIVAEIRAVFANRNGNSLRDRKEKIND